MRALKIIVVLVVIVLIVIIIIWVLGKKTQFQTQTNQSTTTNQEESKTKDLSNINPSDYSETFTANLAKAQELTSQWQKDAELVFVKVQISSDLNFKKITETYVFSSTKIPLNYWTISFDLEKNYLRALIPKTDFLQNETPSKIKTNFWKIDWISAFQKAETAGGKDFRKKYQNDLTIEANLTYSQPKNYLYWIINYQSLTDQNLLQVKIDANSGEVYGGESSSSSSNAETEQNSSNETGTSND